MSRTQSLSGPSVVGSDDVDDDSETVEFEELESGEEDVSPEFDTRENEEINVAPPDEPLQEADA